MGLVHVKKLIGFSFPSENGDAESANVAIGFMLFVDFVTIGIFCFVGYFITN